MSQSIQGFLKPTYYLPEEAKQLKTSVQMISVHKQKGGLNGHALAVAQAVHSIAFATFINIPYYLALGTVNLFLNCVHLNFEHMVLGHYKASMQSLIYSVIATIYVAIGTFIPPVLNGFKMQDPPESDGPFDSIIRDATDAEPKRRDSISFPQRLSLENPSISNGDFASVSDRQPIISNLNEARICSIEPHDESLLNSLDIQMEEQTISYNIEEDPFSVCSFFSPVSMQDSTNVKSEDSPCEGQQYPNEGSSLQNSIPTSSIKSNFASLSNAQLSSLDQSFIGQHEEPSLSWVVPNVPSFAIKSTNIRARDMIGAYGVNLERQAYRIALNEYIRILSDDFNIDANERLTKIANWLESSTYKDNPMVHALYRNLFYLTRPVAYSNKSPIYTNAKEQYEAYFNSLREVIATEQYQKIRQDLNVIGELKECRTLIRALCEARFRSENHGLLSSLLQLHEAEYNRLDPKGVVIPIVTRENFAQVVMAKNKKVTEAPPEMKVSSTQRYDRMGKGGIGYEDFLKTDIPFRRGEQVFKNDKGEERSFYYMRHPTPHVEGFPARIVLGAISRTIGLGHIESGEAIAPEFEGMLEAIAERGESYLIQSHQRLNDSGTIENEDSRSQTLYRLQTSHENFHVVFQAVEGDLFDRKGSYAEIKTFSDLKKAIKASFCDEKSPNRLPAYLEKDEEYHNVIDQLLNQVHQALFEGRPDISFDGQDPTKPGVGYPNHEWQAFILAFYILQGDDLKFRLPDVKYFCTNCKNFFDRGGNRAMAEDRLHQEMSKREVTIEDLEATIVNLIPVPLQSKGKAVIEKRLKPGLALAEILATLSLEDRQRLQEVNFNGYKPDRFEVSKKEQRAVPLIEDARTLQEMQEVLRALFAAVQEKKEPYLLKDNEIVQKNWKPYQGKDQANLFAQVNKDLLRFDVHVDGTRYDAQGSHNAEAIFEYLTTTCGIGEELALKAMAQMQQGIFVEPFSGLTTAFQHVDLDLSVAHAPEKEVAKRAAICITTTGDSIEIKAQNSLLYKTTNLKSAHFRERPIAIFNTIVLATIPKDGSAPNGHWTWEVIEIPV